MRPGAWATAWGNVQEGFYARSCAEPADSPSQVWEVATAKTLHTLTGHTKPVRGVAWSPDGKFLASGSDDHLIKLWDMFHRDQGQE